MPASPPSATRLQTALRTAVALYWIALFLATHLPVEAVLAELPPSDKQLHFWSFALLGCGLPVLADPQSRFRWSRGALLFGILAVYAAVDELLQIPVGRSAEFLDWLADVAGGALGLCAAILAGQWWHRRRKANWRAARDPQASVPAD